MEQNETQKSIDTNLDNPMGDQLEVSKDILPAEKLKHDWYQTESQVVITIFLRNTKLSNINVDIKSRKVLCSGEFPDGSSYNLSLSLLHEISGAQSSWKQYPTKVEIKLKKLVGIRWSALEGDEPVDEPAVLMAAPEVPVPAYPSSCPLKHDWDKLAVQIEKEEEAEKLEGESALNQLFQKIYAEGSDDVKKAMNKSFAESGGTVLSTNWRDIEKEKVDVKPPDGMEWKNWE